MSITRQWDGHDGGEIGLAKYGDCVSVRIDGPFQHIAIDRLPEFVTALYEVAGKPAPIVLERPGNSDTTMLTGLSWAIRDGSAVEARMVSSKVRFTPAELRDYAASLAILAGQAENEPDPAEVEELAEEISAEMTRRGEGFGGVYRVAARTALRWMHDREDTHGC